MAGKVRRFIGTLLVIVGIISVFLAYRLFARNQAEETYAGEQAQLTVEEAKKITANNKEAILEILPVESTYVPDYQINPEMGMPVEDIGGNDYLAVISIPSIGVELPVLAELDMTTLKIAPARYKGSIYTGDMIIAGHNYNTHFGALDKVQVGDFVYLTDMDGNVFKTQVYKTEVIHGYDVEGIYADDADLTLFTCTYSGKDRTVLRCRIVPEG